MNTNLRRFREQQRNIYPQLKLSALDVDEPELTALQLPSYLMKHNQHVIGDATEGQLAFQTTLREAEVELRCGAANKAILAVRDMSLALSAVMKARDLDYRGQAGGTRTKRNFQNALLAKNHEISVYNATRMALIHLGHITNDSKQPYPPMSLRDTRRKETHLHRVNSDREVRFGKRPEPEPNLNRTHVRRSGSDFFRTERQVQVQRSGGQRFWLNVFERV